MGRTSSAAKKRYNIKAYDRIELVVPKGQKASITAAAQEVGESVNMFVQKALLARMGLTEWPAVKPSDDEA